MKRAVIMPKNPPYNLWYCSICGNICALKSGAENCCKHIKDKIKEAEDGN